MGTSTRLSIVRDALDEVVARLDDLPSSPATRGLRVRAFTYRSALDRWVVSPPSEAQREALLKVVLELNIQVMRVARGDPPKE
jgi:hypothetical protein